MPSPPPAGGVPEEPRAPHQPAWAPLLSGAAVGSILAAITGYVFIALFAATALIAAVLAWGSMILVHRRRHRRWRNAVRRHRHAVAGHRIRSIEAAVEEARSRHPSLDTLPETVRLGDASLWSRRPVEGDCSTWDVEVRRDSVVHDVDGFHHECHDVPVMVSLGPSDTIGVFGVGSTDVVRALVARLAAAVGPSDLDVVGASAIDELGIPHWRGTVDHQTSDDTHVHTVIVCLDPSLVASRTAPARRLVASGRAALVVAADRRDRLPHNCSAVIDASTIDVDPTRVDDLIAALSTWSDPDLVGSDVPTMVDWSDLHPTIDDESWSWPTDSCCTARLGAAADGRVDLDLVRDGPHMVVIGTTGSGKSEFLRTLILGLAVGSPPERLQFVLVDFKGGAAFDAVRRLPHVVDVITDLDRDETSGEEAGQRVVDGLRAELVRREHVLRAHGASSLVELENRCDDDDIAREIGDGADVPPRLVIVIDELARLQADVPAFVTALVDLAQRGRSLGMHLVVGTQTAGRVVSSEVLANADIRVALRLQSAGDSTEIVGTPVAARLPRSTPGRAVLRLANDEPVVFQVASTGRVLESQVFGLVECARRRGFPGARPIWCPSLPDVVSVHAVGVDVIGVVDDRRHQRRIDHTWDGSSHVLVVGGRESGATDALRTLARCWSSGRHTAGDESPLIVDFDASHTDDHERVDRTLRLVESASPERPVCVMVDGIDGWSDRQANSRSDLLLWERFATAVNRRFVTVVASSVRDPMGVSRMGERFEHVFVMRDDGPSVPGRCRIEKTSGDSPIGSVMQFVFTPECDAPSITRAPSLPQRFETDLADVWALTSSDFQPLPTDVDVSPVFLVIGPRRSGRTTALRRRADTWTARSANGRVWWIDSVETWTAMLPDADETPSLVVIDDVPRVWNAIAVDDLERLVARGVRIAAAVTPSTLRARSDHPLHVLRRHRHGLVLGPTALDDLELFGVFDRPTTFVESLPGRGWFVDRGELVDLVQIAVPVPVRP